MRKTYYYCYDMNDKKDWLGRSLDQLSKTLFKSPTEIQYTFEELPKEYEEGVLNILEKDYEEIYGWEDDLVWFFSDKQGQVCNLLVICHPGNRLEKVSINTDPDALWGISNCSLAIVYHFYDQYVVWHEMLHLLGADDCYDLTKNDRGPNCELGNCIMQYEATEENVGTWPFLCKKNVSLVKSQTNKWQNATGSG